MTCLADYRARAAPGTKLMQEHQVNQAVNNQQMVNLVVKIKQVVKEAPINSSLLKMAQVISELNIR